MVLLRWTVPHTHNPWHLLSVYNTVAGSLYEDGDCNAYSHFPNTSSHLPIRSPIHAYSELAYILLRVRVRFPPLLPPLWHPQIPKDAKAVPG